MLKLLNLTAIAAVIGTATWAYSMKYETIFHSERVLKLESEANVQRDAITVLKAEWQLLNSPARLQFLADRHLQLKPATSRQIVRAIDVPERGAPSNGLDDLITGSIATPDATRRSTGRTPGR